MTFTLLTFIIYVFLWEKLTVGEIRNSGQACLKRASTAESFLKPQNELANV